MAEEEVEPEGEMESDGLETENISYMVKRGGCGQTRSYQGGLGSLLWGRAARASPPSMVKISLGGRARLPFESEILGRQE